MRSRLFINRILLTCAIAVLLLTFSCKRGPKTVHGEPAYVSAPQVNLRDRLSALYNKAGVVKNGERVEILEKDKHFVRVRSPRGEEGWIEARYLAGPELFNALDQLARENTGTPVEAHGTARAEMKMHVSPGRESESLFRIEENAKVEILKRGTAAKPQSGAPSSPPKTSPPKKVAEQDQPSGPPLEDWWLVRDATGHTGWVLAHMIDVDIPLDIAQYSEGQRIMAALTLNEVADVNPENGQPRKMPQYVTVTNEPKHGTPWDFDQVRVFTWNTRRHRYETAYRERRLYGMFPVTTGHQVFDREGDLPTFTIRVKDANGNTVERLYKLNQTMVRRVLAPGEERNAGEQKPAPVHHKPRKKKN
ncbi:MAG: SH3 domain-containing protein [Terriglobales bacterium]